MLLFVHWTYFMNHNPPPRPTYPSQHSQFGEHPHATLHHLYVSPTRLTQGRFDLGNPNLSHSNGSKWKFIIILTSNLNPSILSNLDPSHLIWEFPLWLAWTNTIINPESPGGGVCTVTLLTPADILTAEARTTAAASQGWTQAMWHPPALAPSGPPDLTHQENMLNKTHSLRQRQTCL